MALKVPCCLPKEEFVGEAGIPTQAFRTSSTDLCKPSFNVIFVRLGRHYFLLSNCWPRRKGGIEDHVSLRHVVYILESFNAGQACSQRAGVRFLKHNVRDEFDDVTDIARLYRIKNVPCFVFFSGGAMVWLQP